MYMLINFTYMFQVVYKSFSCRLEFVQSAFIHKEFCMQKNKVKAFVCCCFSVMSKKTTRLLFSQGNEKDTAEEFLTNCSFVRQPWFIFFPG